MCESKCTTCRRIMYYKAGEAKMQWYVTPPGFTTIMFPERYL